MIEFSSILTLPERQVKLEKINANVTIYLSMDDIQWKDKILTNTSTFLELL
ncbi:MAG: hypothetical protein GFH24_608438n4 [Chloroflexi bacterium AL-N5]|nr:hypothetical protein [Chloroflexi bacterium AL-N5]